MKEDSAQAAAELILIFGGIIIIVLVALVFYKNYLKNMSKEINTTELVNFNNKINNITEYFNR